MSGLFKEIWKKDSRRKGPEKFRTVFSLRLTDLEKRFLEEQSEVECTSENSIIRKAIKQYQDKVKLQQD